MEYFIILRGKYEVVPERRNILSTTPKRTYFFVKEILNYLLGGLLFSIFVESKAAENFEKLIAFESWLALLGAADSFKGTTKAMRG